MLNLVENYWIMKFQAEQNLVRILLSHKIGKKVLSDPNHLKKGLIFVATHSFFPGHILLNSSDSIVPNTFSLVSSLNTFHFFFPGSASIPLEFFSFLTFFIKYFLKFLTFCLQYPALSRLATAFIGDNPIKIALKTFLFIS